MEETENKYEDDAEKKDDDEAAEVERGPVARAEDAQPQHALGPAGPAQAGGPGSPSHPLVLGPAIYCNNASANTSRALHNWNISRNKT